MCQGDSDDIAEDWYPKAVACCDDDSLGAAACGTRCSKRDTITMSGVEYCTYFEEGCGGAITFDIADGNVQIYQTDDQSS